MVVYNILDPSEYLFDIAGFIPWRLEARGRTQEAEIIPTTGNSFPFSITKLSFPYPFRRNGGQPEMEERTLLGRVDTKKRRPDEGFHPGTL